MICFLNVIKLKTQAKITLKCKIHATLSIGKKVIPQKMVQYYRVWRHKKPCRMPVRSGLFCELNSVRFVLSCLSVLNYQANDRKQRQVNCLTRKKGCSNSPIPSPPFVCQKGRTAI